MVLFWLKMGYADSTARFPHYCRIVEPSISAMLLKGFRPFWVSVGKMCEVKFYSCLAFSFATGSLTL